MMQFFNTLTEEVGRLLHVSPTIAVLSVDGQTRFVDIETFLDVWVACHEMVPA